MQNINKYFENVCKYVAKLIIYRILLKDTLTILGLDYRDALLTDGRTDHNHRKAALLKIF